jgi:hypothetical protein
LKKKAAFRKEKQRLHLHCLRLILEPIVHLFKIGGTLLEFDGVLRCVVPVVPFFLQDAAEGYCLCHLIMSCKTRMPCRHCRLRNEHMNNPWKRARLRSMGDIAQLRKAIVRLTKDGKRGRSRRGEISKRDAKKALKKFSLVDPPVMVCCVFLSLYSLTLFCSEPSVGCSHGRYQR